MVCCDCCCRWLCSICTNSYNPNNFRGDWFIYARESCLLCAPMLSASNKMRITTRISRQLILRLRRLLVHVLRPPSRVPITKAPLFLMEREYSIIRRIPQLWILESEKDPDYGSEMRNLWSFFLDPYFKSWHI